MVDITVDGKEYQVDEKKNLIDALKEVGIEVPYYCYHPELSVVGMCRICLIEIENSPKLQPACNTAVQAGMKIRVASEKAIKAREGVMEFLLINHPLDCPVCDKSGECGLQDYSFTVGAPTTRYKEVKRTVPQESIGTNLLINHNRCILCYRCVRFDKEIVGEHDLEFIQRGNDTLIGYTPVDPSSPEEALNHNYQGALTDICPVGALLNKNTLFTSRVWWFEEKQSICHGCSSLCHITTNVKKNELYRYMPPKEPEKYGYFICDQGRFSSSEFSKDRLFHYTLNGNPSTSRESLDHIASRVDESEDILFLGGTIDSIEEISQIEELCHLPPLGGKRFKWEYRTQAYMWEGLWEEKIDFLLMKDQRPNSAVLREKENTGFNTQQELHEGMKKADLIFILNEFSSPYAYISNEKEKLGEHLLYKILGQENLWSKVVLLSTHQNDAVSKAYATLPVQAFVEKSASFKDKNGEIKKSERCIIPPKGLLNTSETIKKLLHHFKRSETNAVNQNEEKQNKEEVALV